MGDGVLPADALWRIRCDLWRGGETTWNCPRLRIGGGECADGLQSAGRLRV